MTEKDIVNNLDAPLEIKSRLDCIDELYRFSQERIAYYETLDKNTDKSALSNPDLITMKTVESLLPFYMVRQYGCV